MSNTDIEITLEQDVSMSDSCLWTHEKNYFHENGLEAWVNKTPFLISSNCIAAQNVAKMVFYFIYDLLAKHGFKTEAPIYILELGAGHARFSFHFLAYFFDLIDRFNLKQLDIKYIVSDISDKNIAFWQTHPRFKKYADLGVIDFAKYYVAEDNKLHLIRANKTLDKSDCVNPVIAIANYLFCDTASDNFKIQGGELLEGVFTTKTTLSNMHEQRIKDLKKLSVNVNYRRTTPDYYDIEVFNTLLKTYQQNLNDTTFLFPITLLKTIEELIELSEQRLFFIVGDKGFTKESQLANAKHPIISIHERDFSTMVNFDAAAKLIKLHGGSSYISDFNESFSTALFLSFDDIQAYPNLKLSYDEFSYFYSGGDHYNLTHATFLQNKEVYTDDKSFKLHEIISLIKCSHYDPDMINLFKDKIFQVIQFFKDKDKLHILKHHQLHQMLKRTLDNYYFMPGNVMYCFEIAIMFYRLEEYSLALETLFTQLTYTPDNIDAFFNIGICFLDLKEYARAIEYFKKVVAEKPDYPKAQKLIHHFSFMI